VLLEYAVNWKLHDQFTLEVFIPWVRKLKTRKREISRGSCGAVTNS